MQTTDTWRIQTMTGTQYGSSIIAIAPGCPDHRHPTRDCACRVFKSRKAAETYIAEQSVDA